MKIFFLCKTGHHTSLLAANYYLNHLETGNGIRIKEIPGFNDIKPKSIGTPYFVGKDDKNNEVYTIGVSSQPEIFTRVIGDYLNILGEKPENWDTINLTRITSTYTKLGIMLNYFRLKYLAAYFLGIGANREFAEIQSVISEFSNQTQARAEINQYNNKIY